MLLTDAMDAAEPLLDLHRVPRHVEVDHRVAELQVASFAPGLAAEQHIHSALKARDCLVLLAARQRAVVHSCAHPGGAEQIRKILQRRRERGEDDDLAPLRLALQHRQERARFLGAGDVAGTAGEVAPPRPLQRGRQRRGARAGDPLQRLQREPCRATGGARFCPHPVGYVAVEIDLRRGRPDDAGLREASRQHDLDLAAAVAHHHLAHPALQLRRISDAAGAGSVLRPELLQVPEVPRLHGGDQMEQVIEAVLDRRGGEQQQRPRLQRAHQRSRGAVRIARAVGLVDDHQVPALRGDRVPQRCAPGSGDRAQQHAAVRRGVGSIREDARRQPELAVELLLPLAHQAGGDEYQHTLGQAAQAQLAEHEQRLDRLAEADLIGEDGPAAHPAQRGSRGAELVRQGLEAQPRQRDEGVEARAHPHLRGEVDVGNVAVAHRCGSLHTLEEGLVLGEMLGQSRRARLLRWRGSGTGGGVDGRARHGERMLRRCQGPARGRLRSQGRCVLALCHAGDSKRFERPEIPDRGSAPGTTRSSPTRPSAPAAAPRRRRRSRAFGSPAAA